MLVRKLQVWWCYFTCLAGIVGHSEPWCVLDAWIRTLSTVARGMGRAYKSTFHRLGSDVFGKKTKTKRNEIEHHQMHQKGSALKGHSPCRVILSFPVMPERNARKPEGVENDIARIPA